MKRKMIIWIILLIIFEKTIGVFKSKLAKLILNQRIQLNNALIFHCYFLHIGLIIKLNYKKGVFTFQQ
jgi:hypothetical protein